MAQKPAFIPEKRFAVPTSWAPRLSPNYEPRTQRVSAIVLHADASANIEATLSWIRKSKAELRALWEQTPASKRPAKPWSPVSYHEVVSRTGAVFSVVHPDDKAFHAGESVLDGVEWVNGFSVGVCLSNKNDGKEPYPSIQVASAVQVCVALSRHYGIEPNRIVTHAFIAPGRKSDPLGLDIIAFRAAVAAKLMPSAA